MDMDPIQLNCVAMCQQPQLFEPQGMGLASARLDGASMEHLSNFPLGVLQEDLDEHADSLTSRPSASTPSPDIAEVVDLTVDLAGGGQADDDGVQQIKSVLAPSIPRHRSKRRGHLHDWTLPSPPILACF